MTKKNKQPAQTVDNNNSESELWKNKYLRALADYQNLEKRILTEIENRQRETISRILLKLLDVYDNIERAEVFVKDNGLQLTKEQLIKVFADEGVVVMDLLGKTYDPYYAECIEIVPGDEDNIILEVVNKGYLIKNTVLRIGKVKVSKKLPVTSK